MCQSVNQLCLHVCMNVNLLDEVQQEETKIKLRCAVERGKGFPSLSPSGIWMESSFILGTLGPSVSNTQWLDHTW